MGRHKVTPSSDFPGEGGKCVPTQLPIGNVWQNIPAEIGAALAGHIHCGSVGINPSKEGEKNGFNKQSTRYSDYWILLWLSDYFSKRENYPPFASWYSFSWELRIGLENHPPYLIINAIWKIHSFFDCDSYDDSVKTWPLSPPIPSPQYHGESESLFPLKLENRTAFGAKNESISSKLSGGFMGLICIHPPSASACPFT